MLKPLLGKPMLLRQIERLKRCKHLDQLVVATSTAASDDAVAEIVHQEGLEVFRGSLEDVLDRYYQAARAFGANLVVRLTADCPLADSRVVDHLVQVMATHDCDFGSNCFVRSYPRGLDVEVMTMATLETLWRSTTARHDREHVTPLVYAHPERFKIANVAIPIDLSELRWTVDYQEDFDFVAQIYQALYPTTPEFGMDDVLRYLILKEETTVLDRAGTR